jgi:NAD(P)-dependent dehydrogenase (short-subunit alcohol dehydrogenase family)
MRSPPSHVDSVSTNASYSENNPEFLEQELLEVFMVNVVGISKTITAFLPLIKQSKIKKVVAISSGMADLGMDAPVLDSTLMWFQSDRTHPHYSDNYSDFINYFSVALSVPYSVSKAALNTLITKYHVAYRDLGILFMSISPGFVDTSEGKPGM